MVGLLLLNVMGYYAVFIGVQYHNDLTMGEALNSDQYDPAEAITIKIPVAIPYMVTNTDFERVDGKFEYQGGHYRLVKQKYANDTLTVVCVRDFENEKIELALANYVKTFTENPGSQKENKKITYSFIKDYLPQSFCLSTSTSGWTSDLQESDGELALVATFESSLIQPPERF